MEEGAGQQCWVQGAPGSWALPAVQAGCRAGWLRSAPYHPTLQLEEAAPQDGETLKHPETSEKLGWAVSRDPGGAVGVCVRKGGVAGPEEGC